MKYIDVKDALYKKEKIFVDVRSTYEYSQGTIPNAIHMPLFNDEERAEIGTIYKNIGVDEAKAKGIEYASVKLEFFYNRFRELSKEKKDIIIFCGRGGLRSGAIVNFLNNLDVTVYQLKGGYKAIRSFTLEYFEKMNDNHEFMVLHGLTGVGKTEILKIFSQNNFAVLDIELLAKNTGSVFGNIGFTGEKTIMQKNFEASILDVLLRFKGRRILVESESKRIGNVVLPNPLFDGMTVGKHILIKTSIENRIKRLVKDYVVNIPNNDELLIESIMDLKTRIGNEKVDKFIDFIRNKNYENVVRELIIGYYDPLYKHSIEKYNYDLVINYDTIDEAVYKIKDYYLTLEKGIKL